MSHFILCSVALYSYCWHDNQCIFSRRLVPFLFFTHPLWFGTSKTSTEYPHLLYGEGLANRGRALFGKNARFFMRSYPWCWWRNPKCAFAFLSLIDLQSEQVFKWIRYCFVRNVLLISCPSWFARLSTIGGFFGWLSINLTYIFFCGSRMSI